MPEPTSDRSYHRAVLAGALITAGAIVLAAVIQRAPSELVGRLWPAKWTEIPATESGTVTSSISNLGTLTARAEKGDRTAQLDLADVYYDGRGVARNHSRALYWYLQAATAGEVRAQTQLGWMYTRAIGTALNRAEAARWFRKAADAGDTRAANYLGWAYVQGWGVPIDYSQGRFWLTKAAAANDRLGLYNLGFLYEHGLGGSPDLQGAITLYKRSAAAGYSAARDALSRLGAAE